MTKRELSKRVQRIVIAILAIMLVFTSLPGGFNVAFGETVSGYDVNKAVAYAKEHYDDFKDILDENGEEGGDCTQFVRECLEAGGVPKDEARTYGYTEDQFISYLVNNGYAEKHELKTEKQNWTIPQWYVKAADNQDTFSVGDGVVYHCTKCGENFHMSFNTGIDEKGFVRYYAQNRAVGDEVLCLIDCSECGASRENVKLYSVHVTSPENGYSTAYNNKAVTGLEARRVNDTDIAIKWNAVSGAAGYKVFIKYGKNSVFNLYKDIKGTSLTFTEPEKDKGYYFAVRPYFSDGGKTYVGKLSNTVTNNDYLLAPTGLKATINDEYKISLSWNKSAGASKYEIYKATSENGTYTKINTTDITGTSYSTSKDIMPGTTYYFKVKAINTSHPAGNSDYSSPVAVKTGNLAAPTNVKATVSAENAVKITWDKVIRAEGYELYKATSENGTYTKIFTGTGNSFNTSKDIAPGTTYYFKVKAISNSKPSANSDYSKVASVKTNGMDKPVLTTSIDKSQGKIKLSWTSVKGATKYQVYRATSSNGTFTKIYENTGTSFNTANFTAGYTYFYKIKAVGAKQTTESDVVKQIAPLAKPVVKAGLSSTGKPSLSWAAVKGADKYEIYRATTESGTYTKMYTTVYTSYTNTSAVAGKTYYYKVKAVSNSDADASALSAAVKKTCPAETVALAVTSGTNEDGKPRLSWEAVKGAEKYAIYRSGYSNGIYTKMYTTTKTSYTNTSAGAGYTYFYKVEALDTNGKVIAKSDAIKQKCAVITTDAMKVDGGVSDAGKPKLSWEKVDGATKYEIYRSGYRNGTYKKMYTTTSTSYTNTSAGAGYTYFYKVKALNANGKAIAESDSVKQLCHLEKPEIIKGNNGDGKPMLTWEKVDGATKYEIYRSGYSNSAYKKMYTTTKTSYTNTSAGAGYTYFYKVVAVSGNNEDANSTSEIIKQKCLTEGLAVTKGNASSGKPRLSWKKVDGATKYEIYRSGYSNGTYKKMYTTTSTSYTNTSATKGYTYFYKVRAINADGFLESGVISVKSK